MANINANPMKVITGKETRWSYANVWEPKSINGGTPKYSVSLIIPKSDTATVQKIKAAIEAAYHEGEAKLKGNGKSVPALSVIKTPLRDGDTERPDDPAYADSYFVNANSATAPGIVDADRNPILTRGEVYSGVYGRASISFYAFNSNGNKGIACGLNNLQKIRDGEPLGGKASAESDFDTEDDDYDEEQNRLEEMIAFLKSEGTAIREYDDSLVRKFIDCIMVYDYSITIRFKTGKEISMRV